MLLLTSCTAFPRRVYITVESIVATEVDTSVKTLECIHRTCSNWTVVHLYNCRQIFRIGTVRYAERLWRMRRHGPVIAHCTDSEDFPNCIVICKQFYWLNRGTQHFYLRNLRTGRYEMRKCKNAKTTMHNINLTVECRKLLRVMGWIYWPPVKCLRLNWGTRLAVGRSLILHRPHQPTGHTGAGGRDLILHRQPVMYQITLFTRHYCVISSAAGGAQAHVRRCLATRKSTG